MSIGQGTDIELLDYFLAWKRSWSTNKSQRIEEALYAKLHDGLGCN